MKNCIYKLFFLLSLVIISSCQDENDSFNDEDIKLGGETSIEGFFVKIFEQPASNLNPSQLSFHRVADKAFGDVFVTAPGKINIGLGPVFNKNSCERCHVSNGRSPFPEKSEELNGLLFRISIPGEGTFGEPLGIPFFGGQLQTLAIFNQKPEGEIQWQFENKSIQLPDGEFIALRKPIFQIVNPYIPLPSNFLMSPRIAPPVIGLGLIEAIANSDLLSLEDPEDKDKNGISGKANRVWNFRTQQIEIGKFGWKAGQPNLTQQTAGAYNQDMGITNVIFNVENCKGQLQDDKAGDDPEINDSTLVAATFYTQSLAVPQRRNVDHADVINGKRLFFKIGCDGCHRQKYITGQHEQWNFLSQQTIFPYSDFLLHDMGEDLADNRSEFEADGKEWRTSPLWGVGLTKVVGGPNAFFLHDGRARTLEEAILWHGGEAEKSKTEFTKLSLKNRLELIAFLESL